MSNNKRALGFWRGWSLVVGGIIGSGIFLLPTLLAPYGLIGLVAWLITGAGAIVLALMLADLSRRMPRIGGPYAYCREAFGDFIGFWIGWGFWDLNLVRHRCGCCCLRGVCGFLYSSPDA